MDLPLCVGIWIHPAHVYAHLPYAVGTDFTMLSAQTSAILYPLVSDIFNTMLIWTQFYRRIAVNISLIVWGNIIELRHLFKCVWVCSDQLYDDWNDRPRGTSRQQGIFMQSRRGSGEYQWTDFRRQFNRLHNLPVLPRCMHRECLAQLLLKPRWVY